jgi:tRNA threonylcarbamoyladenosine biosynthesis protein TsaE
MELNVSTSDAKETYRLGEAVGRAVVEPLVIALTGDLGSGKTVFVQGLAKGLCVPEGYCVTSPSYTLINEYPGRLPLQHVDLYRLDGGIDLMDIGIYDLFEAGGVVAIEWSERLNPQELNEYLALRIDTAGETIRTIHLSSYGQGVTLLLRGLQNEMRKMKWE